MSNEIVLYQPDEISTRIEVRIEDDNVWLNRTQIAELFNRDIKTIGKHINNALSEELCGFQVVSNFATTASGIENVLENGRKYFLLRVRYLFGINIILQFNNAFVIK